MSNYTEEEMKQNRIEYNLFCYKALTGDPDTLDESKRRNLRQFGIVIPIFAGILTILSIVVYFVGLKNNPFSFTGLLKVLGWVYLFFLLPMAIGYASSIFLPIFKDRETVLGGLSIVLTAAPYYLFKLKPIVAFSISAILIFLAIFLFAKFRKAPEIKKLKEELKKDGVKV